MKKDQTEGNYKKKESETEIVGNRYKLREKGEAEGEKVGIRFGHISPSLVFPATIFVFSTSPASHVSLSFLVLLPYALTLSFGPFSPPSQFLFLFPVFFPVLRSLFPLFRSILPSFLISFR